MINPFAKPRMLGQWLLGSVCWLLSLLVSLLLLYHAIENSAFLAGDKTLTLLIPGSILIAHWLVWHKVLFSGWQLLKQRQSKADPLTLLSGLWLLTVLVFQLYCLALIVATVHYYLIAKQLI